eukprot:2427527-Alexandrium_andersonii.AAC.1
MASAPLATPTANWCGLKACAVLFLSASLRSPMAKFLTESAASSGHAFGRSLVLPFLASSATLLQTMTSVSPVGPLAPAT